MNTLSAFKVCLLLGLVAFGSAWADVRPPQWFEFCPAQYENAKMFSKNTRWTPGMYASLLLVPLFPPAIALPLQKSRELRQDASENDYWAQRKLEFDLEIAQCQNASDQSSCHMQLRQLEMQKNAMHQQHLDNVALRRTVNSLRY